MSWETLTALIVALGGLELIKWAYVTFSNRENNARINDAETDASEFRLLMEEITMLQQLLKDKEERFVDQTNVLRQVQRDLLALEKEKSMMEVEYLKKIADIELKMVVVRCDEEDCPFRQPPTKKTLQRAGLSKEEYFANKRKNDKNDKSKN